MLNLEVICPKCGKEHEVNGEEKYTFTVESPYIYESYEGRCEHCGVLLQWVEKAEYLGVVSVISIEGR